MRKSCLRYCTILFGVVFTFGIVGCDSDQLSSGEVLDTENVRAKNKVIEWQDQDCTYSVTDLVAGQHQVVGNVTVTEDGDNYIITYNITENGWCITEIHLDVEALPQDFPVNNSGNPVNGAFEINESYDCITSKSFTVAKSEGTFIAAHAVVNCIPSDHETVTGDLPEMVSVCATAKGTDANNSYFDVTVSGESWLAGDYAAWCADVDRSLDAGHCFDANVYGSYEGLPDGIIENPDNIDLVNWILNQGFIGQVSPSGGSYTFGDVQWAIWQLLDDANCTACAYLGDDWSEEKGQEIVDAAVASGEGYTPGCDEWLAVLLVPTDNSQPIFIPVPIPCNEGCEETAWARGCDFPGNNWAMYFEYNAGE